MIKHSSPLFIRDGHEAALNDERARVIVDLCRSRFAIEDIALSLNCSETLVRALLASQYKVIVSETEAFVPSFHPITGSQPVGAAGGAEGMKKAATPMSENIVRILGGEIHGWLNSFEATDRDREEAIELAVGHLDDSRFDSKGNYSFQARWVIYDVLGVWRPPFLNPGEREFSLVVGRWLAVWVQFWVSDPDAWYRGLALAHARFGEKELAA